MTAADTQWTGLAASRGPDEPVKVRQFLFDGQASEDALIRRCIAIGESRERTRQTGNLRAAYRAGELAGLVKMGAVVGALWGLAWALERKR